MRVLITGGAGFIGSHVVLALAEAGHHPVIVDDLSNRHCDAVTAGEFHQFDIRDESALASLLGRSRIDAVIHLAGLSVAQLARFEAVNVGGTKALLAAMRRTGIDRLLFSSTATVLAPSDRADRRERSLRSGQPLRTHQTGRRGPTGRRRKRMGFANGIAALLQRPPGPILRAALGNGTAVPVRHEPCRPGDPPSLVAAGDRARSELGWIPRYGRLDDMVRHALAFMAR